MKEIDQGTYDRVLEKLKLGIVKELVFQDCYFNQVVLKGTKRMKSISFLNCRMYNCKMKNMNIANGSFYNSVMNVDMERCNMENCNFTGSILYASKISNTKYKNCIFDKAKMKAVYGTGRTVQFSSCSFFQTEIDKIDFLCGSNSRGKHKYIDTIKILEGGFTDEKKREDKEKLYKLNVSERYCR